MGDLNEEHQHEKPLDYHATYTNSLKTPETIPDKCNLKLLSTPEYFRHIRACPNKFCRERYLNHPDVLAAYGVRTPLQTKC